MTGAAEAVQTALVAALNDSSAIATLASGVFDGPPSRAAWPYLVIDDGATRDWSHKTARGREHRIGVTVWDDGSSSARLQMLAREAEAAIEAMPVDLDGHRLVSLVQVQTRIVRDPDGPWAARLTYRARTLED